MKKQAVIIGIILLVGSAVVYYLINHDNNIEHVVVSNNQNVEEDNNTAPHDDVLQQGRGSLMMLLGFGRSVICNFSHEDEERGISSKGEFYLDGTNKQFRVDSTTRKDDGIHVTHMINDGQSAYIWSEGEDENFAMKMSADVYNNGTDKSNMQADTQINLEENVEYDCELWRVDSSKFVPPNNIEFMDMADMFKDMMGSVPEGFELPEGFPGQ